MDRTSFKQRMQSLKTYREQNPGKGYWEWRNSLPDNLKYTDDSEYDTQAAYKSGAQPILEDDGIYHLPSRDPKSGRILKSSYHNTYWKALEEDAKLGYKPIMINGNTYTKRYDDTWAFQNGGETTDIEYNSNIKWSNLGKEEKNYIKNWYDGRYRYAKRHKPELLKTIESARNRFNADNNTVKNFINNKIVNNDFFSSLNTVPISIVNQDVIKGDSNTRGVYSPNEGIKIKKQKTSEQTNDVLLHELSHVINYDNNDIKENIRNQIKDYQRKTYTPNQANEYFYDPEEIHSRLMQFRKNNNLNPEKLYQLDDVRKWRENGKDYKLLESFPNDQEFLDLINNIATAKQNIISAKNGGEVEPPYPQFINGQRVNRITGKPIATGQAKPLFDLEDFFNFTPVGDAITVKDTYDAAKQNDWSTAALSALTLIPFVPTTVKQFNRKYKGVTPKVKREIPTVNKNQVQEQINDIEKERLRRSRLINEADNQGYKIAERLMEDPAYIKRAAKVQKEYGDDYLTTYADILQTYNENPDLLMKSSLGSLQNGARARMEATSDAVRRHMNGGQFPGMGEYNYRIDPTNMRDLTGNVTDHEWNHYVDYLKNKQPDGQGSSNLFKRMSEDIEYSDNPLDIYYGKPTEQKAYMNQLREYMFQNGIISSRDEEVSKELLQDVLNNLTNRNMDSVVRASRRMNNMDNYTKWFNSIPLLGLGAMGINKYYNQQKEK